MDGEGCTDAPETDAVKDWDWELDGDKDECNDEGGEGQTRKLMGGGNSVSRFTASSYISSYAGVLFGPPVSGREL